MNQPGATYRVQLHAGFTFDDAAGLGPYLADLGVTHLYCSPVLQAAPGSTHGYDVVDHSCLSADLGGRPGFDRLHAAMATAGLGIVIDVVPNHMATAGRDNGWWWDVLENGPASLYARHFDIDWDPPEAKLRQRVLVPVLGDHYGRILDGGEISLARNHGEFRFDYADHSFPISPRTLDELLAEAAAGVRGAPDPAEEMAALALAFGRLPHASATDRASITERHRDKALLKGRLERLFEAAPPAAAAVDAVIGAVNADPDRLDALLQRQNYRLAYWRVAGHELDYRRFFDIPGLIAIRTEDPAVFEDSHRLVAELVTSGLVDGLRIDHPDGLRDPAGYLDRLAAATGGAWVVVEKILEGAETLPASWDAAGTTGYEFLNLAGGLLTDPAGEMALTELYREVTGDNQGFHDVAHQAKHEVMATSLATDVERLTELLVETCEMRRQYRDYTRVELRAAIRESLAAMTIYRTYVSASGRSTGTDRDRIGEALTAASERRPDLEPELFGLLRGILLGRHRAPVEVELSQRFQQLSGPVMAKGVEDTAFYRYNRLLCLNEVGGDPAAFGVEPVRFHEHNAAVQEGWPLTMLASSTHDTKRSEDVRARLALLSEIPGEWADAVRRWSRLAERHRAGGWSDPHAELTLFQTMVGAHPIGADRLGPFMLKAARETKRSTSWTEPDDAYESGLAKLVESLAADPDMVEELEGFIAPLIGAGRVNSLSLVTLKHTSPGVPDTYQGTEDWDLSLVDPDNRRPVDFAVLAARLAELGPMTPEDVMARADEGLPKLWLTRSLLHLRRRRPALFLDGDYQPLWAAGPRAAHAVAFVRGGQLAVVVPRLVLGLERAGGWDGTTLALPEGDWEDELTGASWSGTVELEGLLSRFPVSVLVRR